MKIHSLPCDRVPFYAPTSAHSYTLVDKIHILQGPAALRNELAAAKKAVEVLKGEKEHTQQKLEKLHAVLEKERSALRDVLSAARKAVDDLKVPATITTLHTHAFILAMQQDEKAQVETELEEAKGSVITLEAEVERLLVSEGQASGLSQGFRCDCDPSSL